MLLRSQLSQLIRQCKEDSGLSYDEIIERSGVSKTSLRYALNGGDGVSMETMDKILEACGVKSLIVEVVYLGIFDE